MRSWAPERHRKTQAINRNPRTRRFELISILLFILWHFVRWSFLVATQRQQQTSICIRHRRNHILEFYCATRARSIRNHTSIQPLMLSCPHVPLCSLWGRAKLKINKIFIEISHSKSHLANSRTIRRIIAHTACTHSHPIYQQQRIRECGTSWIFAHEFQVCAMENFSTEYTYIGSRIKAHRRREREA